MATINEGANGFHLVTIVTDGYGWLIAEDSEGRELARMDTRETISMEIDQANAYMRTKAAELVVEAMKVADQA